MPGRLYAESGAIRSGERAAAGPLQIFEEGLELSPAQEVLSSIEVHVHSSNKFKCVDLS